MICEWELYYVFMLFYFKEQASSNIYVAHSYDAARQEALNCYKCYASLYWNVSSIMLKMWNVELPSNPVVKMFDVELDAHLL